MIHPAALAIDQLLRACQIVRTRRSGPGGQHRNKVETAVVITHLPSGVKGEAGERRSQSQNHAMAVFRLRVNLALAVRHDRPLPIMPSASWQARCRSQRLTLSASHADFPGLLAEALDVLASFDTDLKMAAQALGISASQLVKLWQLEPRALAQVNARRRELGQAPLR
jgi:UTP:GlnB (protein PII) uridylyltransferase